MTFSTAMNSTAMNLVRVLEPRIYLAHSSHLGSLRAYGIRAHLARARAAGDQYLANGPGHAFVTFLGEQTPQVLLHT